MIALALLAMLVATAQASLDSDEGCQTPVARQICEASVQVDEIDKRMKLVFAVALAKAKQAEIADHREYPGFDDGDTYDGALVQSQRAWEGYADKQCDLEAMDFRHGTAKNLRGLQCYLRLAKERLAYLKAATESNR
ncbi:hypothetical protein DBR17_02555 [Sphingomonas sp. HMWF008]|nr:hypothetical protein DBR17_02555 [Sphingomonas sp. HMWF008]